MKRLNQARILMYSHDTFGLGHLRRCRAIAHALVERFKGLSVLIVSGSQIAGAFDFKARVDFVKIPSVIKLRNGEYTSIDEHIDIQETLEMRASMILHTARMFRPDIFIVDKEPRGLRGELDETLSYLRDQTDCALVLGLRDVMDSPQLLQAEWQRKDLMSTVTNCYDAIWVYGTQNFWNPLQGFDLPQHVSERMVYTGFLDRPMPTAGHDNYDEYGDFILVTAGGGGDGADLFSAVLAAYEQDEPPDWNAVLVLGPFMPSDQRIELTQRASKLNKVFILDFEVNIERLMARCCGMVGMCGYNTFCELLSFDKRGLVVPRSAPRMEQYVRAHRAMELGLLDVLSEEEAAEPEFMAKALQTLPIRPKPSQVNTEQMLHGLDNIADMVEIMLTDIDGGSQVQKLSIAEN